MMKKLENFCIDCGSPAVNTTVDEVKRVHKLMVVTYECGAVLRSSFSANGNVGKLSHSGCTADDVAIAA